MNDAEMINQSSYRRAFRYLKSSIQQNGLATSRVNSASTIDVNRDLEAVMQTSNNQVELVFFPSYARYLPGTTPRLDVRIHGWVYSPVPIGKQTRRNRYTMLLARSLAGLPSLPINPKGPDDRPSTAGSNASVTSTIHESEHIPYSASTPSSPSTPVLEEFKELFASNNNTNDEIAPLSSRKDSEVSIASESSSFRLSRHFSDNELVTCHANLSSRMAPFLAKPLIKSPIKVDLYLDNKLIMSENMYTEENGHFRGTIEITDPIIDYDKIDTLEARIAESEAVSGTTPIKILHDSGVSVISDMDDTVKHTDIVAGVREAFRNAFVRDLATLEVPGVKKWYHAMRDLGCPIHYVSNAPYQLWPCLASFLKIVELPLGTIHLKQYTGMIQGLFEPAAEKKRANVTRILLDFPQRKFLLIGDSGEQDLELYTDLAQSSFASQILGIFIRDVSSGATPTDDSAGETGEGFFSAGAQDNTIDVKSDELNPAGPKKPQATVYDMLTLQDDLPSSPTDLEPKRVSSDQPRQASGKKSSGLRRLLIKAEDAAEAIIYRKPALTRSPTATSTASSPTSPTKRPSLLRSVSASSANYVETRKLTEAQKMSRRVARSRALLPAHIKLYIWKNGEDCQLHAEALIEKAMAQAKGD